MATTTDRPDCYACAHRREVPGSAHSRCAHPAVPSGPLMEAFSVLAGRTNALARFGTVVRPIKDNSLGVTGHPHGIEKGWFAWPWNFDPTWLLTCDGFDPTRKESTDG